jgi:hypothetical protein
MPPTERPKGKPAEQAFGCLPRRLIPEIDQLVLEKVVAQ